MFEKREELVALADRLDSHLRLMQSARNKSQSLAVWADDLLLVKNASDALRALSSRDDGEAGYIDDVERSFDEAPLSDSLKPAPSTISADVLAMKEACKRAVYEADYLEDALANIDAIEIDKLSPEVKADASPPDWKQDQAETTRIKPPAKAEGGRDEPVAIKPLEWDKHPDEDEWFSHDHGLYDVSEYLVYKSPVSTTAWCLKVRGILLDEDFLGPDAAKAAAQSDYEARIRSALVVPPASPPDVEAISPLDESAIRRDEREKCAAEVERANWPCVGDARRIASAIRTGGQK